MTKNGFHRVVAQKFSSPPGSGPAPRQAPKSENGDCHFANPPLTRALAQQPTAVLAQQDHAIRLREHEQSLGALANSVSTLRTMGGEIRSELLLQNSMLYNLDHGVNEVQRTLDAQQGRHEAAYAADG